MKKRKVMIGMKKSITLFEIPIWSRYRFGVHLSKGEKPKFRFMFYLSHYDEEHAEDLLIWWTFIDLF